MDYNINNFSALKFRENSKYLIIGPPKSGKTTLLKDIMKINIDGYNSDCTYIGKSLDKKSDLAYNVNEPHQKIILLGKPEKYEKTIKTETIKTLVHDYNTLIAYDDVLFPFKWTETSFMKGLINYGVLRKTGGIICTEYIPEIPSHLKINIDYILISGMFDQKDLEIIYNEYAGIVPSFDDFCLLYNSLSDYDFLIVDNTAYPFNFYKYRTKDKEIIIQPRKESIQIDENDILSGKMNIGISI